MSRDALPTLSTCFLLFLLLVAGPSSRAQESSTSAPTSQESALKDSIREMQLQIQDLQAAVREIRSESERYRAETSELKHELQITLEKLNASSRAVSPQGNTPAAPEAPSASGAVAGATTVDRLARLEEDQQLLESKVDEQNQTKVETASKYRMRLSGILLMDLFSNNGNVDHIENPSVALAPNAQDPLGNIRGSFGATFRQSQLGLEIFGPSLAGAKTSANFVADFFGEFPESVNGPASGSLRLRTGTITLQWENTSLVGGMDSLFFSPKSPNSFASLGIPALSYSGNLWSWTPQVRVEHRFHAAAASTITVSGGILDPLTGETPPHEFLRVAGAGEASRQPGYGGRIEWSRQLFGRALTAGLGGYYSRENWGFNRNIDGWAGTADWSVPLGGPFRWDAKLYAGNAIGGLGAGIGRSVVWNGLLSSPSAVVQALRSVGGWTQLTFAPTAKLEFNGAVGQDSVPAADVRGFAATSGYFDPRLTRNQSQLVNMIYRPRSNLVLSTEFRTLRTFSVDGTSERANQLSLIMGVLF